MIELNNLSIGYNNRHNVRTVASDISANIFCGQLTCLLGDNGTGKSTLLRTLAGFQPPLAGNIFFNEHDDTETIPVKRSLSSFSDIELAKTVGIVLTEKPDVGQMTVTELVALGRSPYTGFWGRLSAEDYDIVYESIAKVGISPLARRMVNTLSDGERQKVMIAKALAQQTPVILLDEPTAFLDYHSKVEILSLLKDISHEQKKTVFLSTHDLELALQVADILWLMTPGNVTSPPSCIPAAKTPQPPLSTLTTGAPKELAQSGALTQFIQRRGGVKFHPDTLTVTIDNK